MMSATPTAAILAGGSLHTIAKQWNAGDVPTRRGNRWSGATVRQLLMSWRNAGLAVYKGEPVGDGRLARRSSTATCSTACGPS